MKFTNVTKLHKPINNVAACFLAIQSSKSEYPEYVNSTYHHKPLAKSSLCHVNAQFLLLSNLSI